MVDGWAVHMLSPTWMMLVYKYAPTRPTTPLATHINTSISTLYDIMSQAQAKQ